MTPCLMHDLLITTVQMTDALQHRQAECPVCHAVLSDEFIERRAGTFIETGASNYTRIER
mgnify:CR=1 FL=1